MPHNSVKTNILKLITLRFALVTVMLCVFSGAAFAQLTATFKNYNGTVLYVQKNIRRGQVPQYKGSTPTRPADAQYTYTFKGWSPAIKAITTNTTYTAQFTATARKYTITFLNGDGSTLQSSSVAYGSTPSCSSTPTKAATAQYTYTFKAWSPAIAKVTGAATYTPTFNQTVRSYAIKFVDGDGKTVQSSTLQYGATPSYTGSTPTKTATAQYTYTFKAWSPTIAKVTGAATYTATFNQTVRSYTITFLNGDKSTLQSSSFAYGSTPSCNKTPTKAATAQYTYTFKGWKPAIAKVTGPATYEPDFTPVLRSYTITFKNEDGTTLQSTNVAYGTKPTYSGSTPTKASTAEYDYRFGGWSPAIETVTEAKVYTALFSPIKRAYPIKFVNYDGTVLQDYSWDYGTTPRYTGSTPTRPADAFCSSYTFSRWYTPITSVTGEKTYYAQFNSTVIPTDALENSHSIGLAEDICGNKYNVVRIGSQLWMAENMRCNRYDTRSERASYRLLAAVTQDQIYDPYYTDGRKVTSTRQSAGQIQMLGFLYNWAAAVGLANEAAAKAQTADFVSDRQGICPNGWHLPSYEEWKALETFIQVTEGYGTQTAGGHLKTTTGWMKNNGDDIYGFSALPTGYAIGSTINNVDADTDFWTSTPGSDLNGRSMYLYQGYQRIMHDNNKKYIGRSVRCVRADEDFVIKFVDASGKELQSDKFKYGQMPVYRGQTPTKADDVQYTYTFANWDSEIKAVTDSKTYKAQFKKELKPRDAPVNGHSMDVVTDICGNKYNVVKIGFQFWLAENIRCTKYDTESERPGAAVPTTPGSSSYNPYYKVYPTGSDETRWNGQLLASQIPYLGTFFSWSGAVGFATGTEALAQTTSFENRRQGICPNGWHLPTTDEWHVLVDFIELTDGKGVGTAGKHMKTTTGWYNNTNGLDTYGFSALPADRAAAGSSAGMGGWGKWWTSDAISDANVSTVQVYHGGDNFMFGANEIKSKSTALCVRCVKNPEKFEIKFVNYDGTELQSTEVEYGSLPEYKGDTPVRDADAQYTYTFSGWSPEVAVVTEAATYTAQYDNEVNKYVIRFLDEDGTELQSSEFDYGATPAYTGETPTKEATVQYTYTFAGWDSEIAEVTGAKDYTAIYTPTTNKYVVRFLNEDGTELQSEELDYGATPAYTGETPTKEATAQYTYTFAGWDSEITEVTGAKNYTATYTSTTNKYVVRFLNEDGTELQSEELAYGATPAYTGETPTKDATAQYTYTFAGWDSEIAEVTGAKDYTATYTPTTNKYVVRFLNEDGTELQSEELEYGVTPAYAGETPTKEATAQYTYTFNGWDSEITAVTGAKDYTATYTTTTNKYVVRFLNEDGTELQSEELEYGVTPAYTGETPTKDATAQYTYTFNGWDSDIEAVTGAKDYTATYTPTTNKYVVRFLNDDGTELQSEELEYGATPAYTGETPTKEATAQYTYTFAGWDSEIAEVTGAKDYTAIYTPTTNKYTVRFLNDDGTELQSEELEYGATPEYKGETPTKDATAQYTYTFAGWDSEIADVTGAKDYTATYTPSTNKYVVRFLNEDGTELQSEELAYGATPEYKGETPTKDATSQYTYTFAGWDSEIADVTGAKDYTATYTPTTNKYVVRFLNEDGTELQSDELDYGATPAYTGETPTKQATAQYTYTFNGWDSDIEAVTGAKDYTATYTPTTNKYTVRFLNDDGTELQSEELEYGVTPAYTGETPTKDATAQYTYTFNGWDSEIAEVTGAKDYTATYTPTTNKYTVRFLNEDGEELQSEELEYGTTPAYTGETPTKEATAQYTYTFNGWDSDIEAVTGAKDYTATYTPTTNKYVVRFLNEDGTELQSEELEYGVTPAYTGETPTKQATAQYTYTFAGWNNDIVTVTGAKDYTATYTPTTNKYVVRFLNEDGTELQSEELEYGATPAYNGETPTKDATAQYTYTFAGWDSEIVEVSGAKDYTATYSPTTNKYVVRFLNEDGTELQSEELDYGATPAYTGETPTKEATAQYTYTFNGWDSDIEAITGAKDYTATYAPTTNKYLITFENYDGEELQSGEVEYGQTPAYTGATPEKPADDEFSYYFTGWSPEVTSVVGTQTYTAQFGSTTNTYVVRFLNDDGTVLQSEELEYGVTPAYTGETPTKEATAQYTYTFNGWDSEIVAVTGAKDYTATYTPTTNKYTVRFLNYDGTELQSEELDYGATPAYAGETPTKEATAQYTYTFNGWNSEIVEVTGAKDYTAIYTPTTNKYLITFENYDGEELQSGEVEYGQTPSYEGTTPVKPSDAENTYVFIGWSPEITTVTAAQTYKAQYRNTTNTYIIRFLNEDGTELQSSELEYGVTPAYTGETPTKEATAQYTYTFNGWDSEIVAVTGAKDYTATYTPTTNKYVVRFLNEDGTELQSSELEYGVTPAYTGETPTKEATAQYTYTFNGWDSDIEAVTGAKDYTATYTSTTNKYVVRFLNDDGTELQSEELAFGAIPAYNGTTPTKDATAQYTYTFAGWDSEIAEVTGAKDYTATYSPTTNKYEIKFVNYDGTELQSSEVEYGQTPSYTGEAPEKPADAENTYTFTGWSPSIESVTEAKTYTAQFSSTTNKYLIRFLNEDGTELQSEELEYGVTPAYTGETPTKEATAQYTYTFAGWDSEIAEVTGAKDYTATYTPTTNKYVVRFLNEDGTELQSSELEYGVTPAYTGETPTKDATAQYTYTFAGWDSEIAEVTGAKDYTATYTPTTNKYTVRFLNEDGTELQSEELEYGVTPAYTGETPTKKATAQYTYTFNGWDAEIAEVTGAKDYRATYTSTTNKYLIRFLNEDGTELQSEELAYGATPAYTGETPTKQATAQYTYTFNGWDSDIEAVTGAKDYTATYTPTTNKYVVRFLNEDGTELQSEELEYGVTPAYTGETPTKDATAQYTYTFAGWDSEIAEVTGAKDYTAIYTPTTNKYTVRFLNYDGTELQSEELDYGATPAYAGETPTKEATAQYTYTFNGWNSEIVEVTGAKDYTAIYTPTTNKYLITFENYDGEELQSGEVEYGQTPSYEGTTPVKPADAENTYTFTGWSPELTSVTEAKIYTAQFSSTTNLYTVRFLNEDGTELQSEELEYGATPEYKGETPTKDATAQYSYVFNGWDSEIAEVTGAKDYTATYTPTTNKYLITFENYDGEELQSVDVEYGQTPTYTGATPVKPADAENTYVFNGWSPEITTVTAAQTYKAQFRNTTNTYIIRFLNEDGTELQSEELEYGATPAYNGETPTKEATAQYTYTFNGWDSEIAEVTGAKDYTATYAPTTNKYVVRFLNEDGTELQSEELEYGATPAYTGETPTKEATAQYTYTFAGWDSEIAEVTGAKDYTATYTPTTNKYTVRFLNEDGEELQSEELEYGTTPEYTGETPTKEATAQYTYTFNGWDSEIAEVTGAKDYTATYTPTTNKYVVRFLNEDGTELQSEELEYGATPAYTGETPTKEATAQYTYTFNGWDAEIAEVAGAKDYTATYTPTTNKYLITFENYDGEVLQSVDVEYGQTPTYTGATPVKPADAENTYVFNGWSPEITTVTAAQTYKAQFRNTTNTYIIRFLNDDGTELQSEELEYGVTPAYTGETPTKDATAQYTYTFNGWDSDIEAVTGAKDYTATYTPTTNKYLITFENYNGDVLQSGEVEYGQTPTYTGATPVKPADAESTYTFSGWSPNITAVTGAQTYTAVFTKVLNTYTVTAEVTGDGGTVSGGGTYSYGTEVTLTATPEHGYQVSKWSTGETSAEIKITVTEDMAFTVSFIHQTADNTPECANAPAVAKYDWLLMLNANALKDKGYNLNENIVDWYRVVGEMDNLDSGERDDEKVGTGYYYTINSKLNDSGDYYALIDLPWQTTEVGCSGLMRTVVFHYAPKGSTKRAMAVSPTITYPEQEIEVRNLPQEEVEVYVYDVAGRLYRSFRTNGETTAAFNAEPMAGTYIVVVWTSKGKETFKYIVRKR